MALSSLMVPLGTPAPDFALPALGGGHVKLADLTEPALLVAFLCNHCPYVRHIESKLATTLAEYIGHGLSAVAVASNDTDAYPDDGEPGLAAQVERTGFTFPYLLDTDQRVALAYKAACTPDFFLYDAQRRLAYRGSFDTSRPGSPVPVTGDLLSAAIEHVRRGEPVPEPHRASIGCGLKWKPGNDPN